MTLTSVSTADPRQAQFAAQAAQELLVNADETDVPQPADTIIDLPGGWVNPSSGVETTAEVRELTGADEEALSRITKDGEPDWIRYVSEIMARGLVNIGSYPADAPSRGRLLIGDQAAILLGIRRATYGDEYETRINCQFCNKQSDVAYDLRSKERGGDIEYKRLDDPENIFRSVPLRNGQEAEVRLVTVADQHEALKDLRRTTAEQDTILLARCVRAIDGQPLLGEAAARDLSAGNRRTLEKHLYTKQPGPQLGEVKGQCPVCSREISISLSMPALFQ